MTAFRAEAVEIMLEASGVSADSGEAERYAAWAGLQLDRARSAFDALAFEGEPAQYAERLARLAP